MKNLKKFLALALSASMVMGMTMTSMAAEPEVSVDAPIYIYDVTNIVVPTTFAVAFNPDQLAVTKGTDTVNEQIVSKNYGIINKSTKDKIITVTLKVEDLNGDKIKFVDDLDVGVEPDDYAVALKVVPANANEVKIGTESAVLSTSGADLANVVMTPCTDEAQSLKAGENEIDFLLEKAVFDGTIDLDTQTSNNVNSAFTPQELAASGKGITAFTFQGTMNENADWSVLTKGIRITAVYSNETAPVGATPVANTGALFVNPNPTFKTGAEVGTIRYKAGTSDTDALNKIQTIKLEISGAMYDGYNAKTNKWPAATNENGLITLPGAYMTWLIGANPGVLTKEAVITYTTVGGDTRTAKVMVRLRESLFSTGSSAGTINYIQDTTVDSVASISKVEMDIKGVTYNGFAAKTGKWAAGTYADGVITMPTGFMDWCRTEYPSDTTIEATVTYVTVGGETKTATVNVKLR